MTAHTPGPWGIIRVNGEVVIDANGGRKDIATVTPRVDESQTEANARLIAHAPALLEALQALVAVYDRVGGPLAVDPATSAARAAIANATGVNPA